MSQITTHILDTSIGKPVQGVRVTLFKNENDQWLKLSEGITNKDGRITDLLKPEMPIALGIYKLRFDTKGYYDASHTPTFYPFIEIVVDIQSPQHYHIPLLLNPFGFSTYRGS